MFNELFKNLPAQTTADATYYVDPLNGVDTNSGLTSALAYKTFAMIPKTINHHIDVQILTPRDGFIAVEEFNGSGILDILIDDGATSDIVEIYLLNCTCNIRIVQEGVTVQTYSIVTNCKSVRAEGLYGITLPTTSDCYMRARNSKVDLYGCVFIGSTGEALYAYDSEVSAEGCTFTSSGTGIILLNGSVFYDVGTNTYTTYSAKGGSKIITVDATVSSA
jgi:hypothetical protein